MRKAHTASYTTAHIKTDVYLATAYETAHAHAYQPAKSETDARAYETADSAAYLEADAGAHSGDGQAHASREPGPATALWAILSS